MSINRSDFPVLKNCVYLNSAFTGLTPKPVIEKINQYYLNDRASSVGQFEYILTQMDTAYRSIARLINSVDENGNEITDNIAICASCGEAIALAARALGNSGLNEKDNIVLSQLEYCANIVPWVKLQDKYGVKLRIAEIEPDTFEVPHERFISLIDRNTRMVAISHVSSLTGRVNEISKITHAARNHGAYSLVDGAQACSAISVDVKNLRPDFYAYSGHKALGPTGAGVLWSSERGAELLEATLSKPNFVDDGLAKYSRFWGNSMSNCEGILGLGWTSDYLLELGISAIESTSTKMSEELYAAISDLPSTILVSSKGSTNITSFMLSDERDTSLFMDDIYSRKIVGLLMGVNSFPLMPRDTFGSGIIRLSVHFYNNSDDISIAKKTIKKTIERL